jgi:hypothetical protein
MLPSVIGSPGGCLGFTRDLGALNPFLSSQKRASAFSNSCTLAIVISEMHLAAVLLFSYEETASDHSKTVMLRM